MHAQRFVGLGAAPCTPLFPPQGHWGGGGDLTPSIPAPRHACGRAGGQELRPGKGPGPQIFPHALPSTPRAGGRGLSAGPRDPAERAPAALGPCRAEPSPAEPNPAKPSPAEPCRAKPSPAVPSRAKQGRCAQPRPGPPPAVARPMGGGRAERGARLGTAQLGTARHSTAPLRTAPLPSHGIQVPQVRQDRVFR